MIWVKQCFIAIMLILCLRSLGFAGESNKICHFAMEFGQRVGSDTRYMITSPLRMDKKDIKNLLIFSGILQGLMSADSRVREEMADPRYDRLGKLDPLFEKGHNFFCFVIMPPLLYELISKDNKSLMLLSESLVINAGLTALLKEISGRPRHYSPMTGDGDWDEFKPFSGMDAFPSHHTSAAFTVATVISNQHPAILVKILSYTIAGLVGFQRIHSNAHSSSDVFAGAVLGTLVGNTICSLDKKRESGDVQITFNSIKLEYKF
ncbi:MAG: phosphatase PAP2 family protein [bacterium]